VLVACALYDAYLLRFITSAPGMAAIFRGVADLRFNHILGWTILAANKAFVTGSVSVLIMQIRSSNIVSSS
jgi:hypothetical protein